MSHAISFTGRLGDVERHFSLTAAVLPELERATGSGILAMWRRITAVDYLVSDLVEPARFGLIGAGENPAEAARLVDLHVKDRPFAEVYPLALGIIEARLFGRETKPDPAPVVPPAHVEPAPVADPHPEFAIGSE